MVWFYREVNGIPVVKTTFFQSHYGLILSISIQHRWTNSYFQSHYGLILSDAMSIMRTLTEAFNPTMVWFYPETAFNLEAEPVEDFQSHYGLILSIAENKKRELQKWLSIPLWSDFIVEGEPEDVPYISFQSHYGLILSGVELQQHRSHRCTFQSHYGLILSAVMTIFNFVTISPFQSHYGLILSVGYPEWPVYFNQLSIPLWSDFILRLSVEKRYSLPSTFNPTMVWFYHFSYLTVFWFRVYLSIPLWSDFIIYYS